MVKCATIEAAVNLELNDGKVFISVYATSVYNNSTIVLKSESDTYIEDIFDLSPNTIFEKVIDINVSEHELTLSVYDCDKNLLVEYTPKEIKKENIPLPAKPALHPSEISTNEALYITGLHLEQYRHATYEPEDYYIEGLKRDKNDIRINNAYGTLLLRRGLFNESESYFRCALERLISRNPNPYDSEPYYNLGLSLFYQGKYKDSFHAFYKATWSAAEQEGSFYYLSAIECINNKFSSALELIDKSIVKNYHNMKARALKSIILRKLGKLDEALKWTDESALIDPLDFGSKYELYKIAQQTGAPYLEALLNQLKVLMRDNINNYVELSTDYSEAGFFDDALEILSICGANSPMLNYYKGYYSTKLNKNETAIDFFRLANKCDSKYCFPNKLMDLLVLQCAIALNPEDAKAYYYLGNVWYDKKQYDKALLHWEKSAKLDDSFPTVFRNLSLAYYNKKNDKNKAQVALEKAFNLDTTDARVFLELDQLYKKLSVSHNQRLLNYELYKQTFLKRDDLYTEYITLHNSLGQHEKAYELIVARQFHPWEGGEGKISAQYVLALTELAKNALSDKDYTKAITYLEMAKNYPHNLGEGKLAGAQENNINYYLGLCYEKLEDTPNATKHFTLASTGIDEPAGMMFYNDQPADMILYQGLSHIKLHQIDKANTKFNKLINYGNQHMNDVIKIDYFAVSLPDFLIFDEDLDKKNKVHCHYLIALGNLGLEHSEKAKEAFDIALGIDSNHIGAIIHKKWYN